MTAGHHALQAELKFVITKVPRTALQNAPSAASLILGTDATVAILEGNQPAVDPEPVSPNAAPDVIAEPAHCKAARYVWALLLARIYEVRPLVCPKCGGDMRIFAFNNGGPVIREILSHLHEPTAAPSLAPARGPPLWELPTTEPPKQETDPQAQPASDYEFDQRVA